MVPDASSDERFHDNPLVTAAPNIRFYAGCPLTVGNGGKVGTLCVIDREPREFGPEDMGLLRDLARMVEQELEAVQMATMDGLTQLSNRRGFEAMARHALDLFKQINDRFGHAEGDRALASFARMLSQTFRESDAVGRLQFNVERHNRETGLKYELQYSVGALSFDPERHADIAQFMAETNKLMYKQKRGRQQARGSIAALTPPAFATA